MDKMIFVNLAVEDVAKATAFYQAIGCTQDARFSNEVATSMQWSDTIVFMLLAKPFYSTFTPKQIADSRTTSEVLLCLAQEDRAAVDAIAEKALAAGGKELHGPDDKGFMYGRAFEDLDGHGFEVMTMDMAAFEAMSQSQPA